MLSHTKLLGRAAFTALLLAAPQALAQAPTVGVLTAEGDGCPGGSGVSSSLTQDGNRWVYGLVLADLDAATVLPGTTDASEQCDISVDVTPPPGYQMRIGAVLLQGRHDAPSQGTTTTVRSSYQLQPVGGDAMPVMSFAVDTNQPLARQRLGDGWRIASAQGIGAPLGNWDLSVESTMDQWAPCNAAVTLSGSLTASARSDDGRSDAEVAVQRADVAVTRSLGWGWSFRRCDGGGTGGWNGRWQSSYAVQGDSVAATLDLDGAQGTYRTASFVGRFYDLAAVGAELRGHWQASGSYGWVRFTLQPDGRSFRGVYGFGDDPTPSGAWNGRR
jgi:hypothetical protein